METHGVCVGVPHHLAQDIHLLGNPIDVLSVVLGQLLQLVSSLCGIVTEEFSLLLLIPPWGRRTLRPGLWRGCD